MSHARIDKDIIHLVGARSLSATAIAEKSEYGRTTINYRLNKLVNEGFLSSSRKNARVVLYAVNKKAVNDARESRIVETFSGSNIVHGYQYFLDAPKGTVVYGVQGLDAAKMEFKVLPKSFIEYTHATYKKRKIILKIVSNKQIVPVFNNLSKNMVRSHIGRTIGAKHIEGNIFLGSCEIMSAPHVFMISNLTRKKVFICKDKYMSQMVYELFSLLYDSNDSRIFPLNQHLQKMVDIDD